MCFIVDSKASFLYFLILLAGSLQVNGHGRLMWPPGRGTVFRHKEFSHLRPRPNYGDHALNCGGHDVRKVIIFRWQGFLFTSSNFPTNSTLGYLNWFETAYTRSRHYYSRSNMEKIMGNVENVVTTISRSGHGQMKAAGFMTAISSQTTTILGR